MKKKPAARRETAAYNFEISTERLERMKAIRERLGTPIAVQIRKGVDLWLAQQEGEAK
jgi:hypothetical protein